MMKRRNAIGKLQRSKICVLIKSSFFSGKTNNITAKNKRKQIVTNRLMGTKIMFKKKSIRHVKHLSTRNKGLLESN